MLVCFDLPSKEVWIGAGIEVRWVSVCYLLHQQLVCLFFDVTNLYMHYIDQFCIVIHVVPAEHIIQ